MTKYPSQNGTRVRKSLEPSLYSKRGFSQSKVSDSSENELLVGVNAVKDGRLEELRCDCNST